MSCERCGSINVVRTRSSAVDRVLRFLTGKKRVSCKRCLWTGRVRWDHEDSHVQSVEKLRAIDGKKAPLSPSEIDFDLDQFH